jgi:predicted phosphate transport protein (TIGR00153 family)
MIKMKNNKDYSYFDAFVNLSKFCLSSAEILDKTLREFDVTKIEDKIIEMHNIEHSADIAKHDLLNRLVKEFLPPIEREDITSLSQKIDDVTDAVEDVLMCIDIFNVQTIRPEILKFTEMIVDCCKSMDVALVEFEHFKRSKRLHAEIIEINRLEEEGDALYVNGVRNLYKTSKDPVELMVWTEVFRRLEKCCDACEDVANDIENIVMKNS